MSTWIMHLRVAEKLRPMLGNLDEVAYYAGAIAPDSGKMIDNFTYVPDKDTSHWKREDVPYAQRFLDNAEFYYKYCENEKDLFKKSLFWGYYIHILTDTIYVRDLIHPYIAAKGKPFWKEHIEDIRKGWYEIDYRYLEENLSFVPFEKLKELQPFENDFLDYFEKDEIYERIAYAIELYGNAKSDKACIFFTHTPKMASEMAEGMAKEIGEIVKNHLK